MRLRYIDDPIERLLLGQGFSHEELLKRTHTKGVTVQKRLPAHHLEILGGEITSDIRLSLSLVEKNQQISTRLLQAHDLRQSASSTVVFREACLRPRLAQIWKLCGGFQAQGLQSLGFFRGATVH